eukprot:g13533.t1
MHRSRRLRVAVTCLLAALLAALQPPLLSAFSLTSGGRVGTPGREPPAPAPSASREKPLAAVPKVPPDNVQLDAVRQVFERPRLEGIEAPPEALPGWLTSWSITLQNQLDGVFASLDHYRRGEEGLSKRVGFKIVIVGDSTMRMQAKVLSSLLASRTHADGRRQCFDIAHKGSQYSVHWSCMGRSGVVGREVVLTIEYVQANEVCVSERNVNADFVYFGCGLRLLQLIPDRPEEPTPLDTWVHYERLLEDAVIFYRSGGGNGKGNGNGNENGNQDGKRKNNKKPIGLAFMTTHSFAVERLEGDYKTRVAEYAERKGSLLELCSKTVDGVEKLHPQWPNEFDPEDICTRGTFDEAGVVNINRRAESVMARLGVPLVRGYDTTRKQAWATLPADGRHYPALIPLELHSFLVEVTSALRREVLTTYSDARHTSNGTSDTFDKTAADYYHYDDDGEDGDSTLSVFMPLSVALLVLCLVGFASAATAAFCTLRWSKRPPARPNHGGSATSRRCDL